MTATPDTVSAREQAALQEPLQLNSRGMRITIAFFVAIPLLAVIAAIPVAWGGWLSWVDIALMVVFYAITAIGITVGYHRYFTHGSFKVGRGMKIVLGVIGSMALQGSLDQWVADHRKHHKYSDEVGDPHSPWRFGTSKRAVAKGLYYAHVGWLFDASNTPISKYAPDIAADKDLRTISRWFPAVVITTLLLPALLGGLITWSWAGALTAFFWATPRPRRARAPHHLVDQLDLPRVRHAPVRVPRHVDERLVAGDPGAGRVLAQPAPRRAHRGAARRADAPARPERPADPRHGAHRPGPRCPLAQARARGRQAQGPLDGPTGPRLPRTRRRPVLG